MTRNTKRHRDNVREEADTPARQETPRQDRITKTRLSVVLKNRDKTIQEDTKIEVGVGCRV